MSDDEHETHDEPTTEEAPEAAPEEALPVEREGILANEHDVDKLSEDIAKLLAGLAQRGLPININQLDINNLKARVESVAACRMLIAKGICTEAEMAAFCNTEFKAILITILQIVEEQRLQAQGPRQDRIITPADAGKLATVRKPKLAVVRH